MARRIFFTYAVVLFLSLPALARIDRSVELSIGGNVFFNQWMPVWGDGKVYLPPRQLSNNTLFIHIPFEFKEISMDPGVMAGPSLSLRFLGRFTLSSVFLMGEYQKKIGGVNTGYSTIYSKDINKILKYDSDSTLSFNITDFMKIFIGFKYQGIEQDEKLRLRFIPLGYDYISESKGSAFFKGYGPGLGLGFTIPLHKGLYLLYNISGSMLFGAAAYDFRSIWTYESLINFSFNTILPYSDEVFYAYSGNSALSLAYYIEKANMTLSLGFRYQLFYYQHKAINRGFLRINGKYDHQFGAVFSVVYSFKIGGKKDKEMEVM